METRDDRVRDLLQREAPLRSFGRYDSIFRHRTKILRSADSHENIRTEFISLYSFHSVQTSTTNVTHSTPTRRRHIPRVPSMLVLGRHTHAAPCAAIACRTVPRALQSHPRASLSGGAYRARRTGGHDVAREMLGVRNVASLRLAVAPRAPARLTPWGTTRARGPHALLPYCPSVSRSSMCRRRSGARWAP